MIHRLLMTRALCLGAALALGCEKPESSVRMAVPVPKIEGPAILKGKFRIQFSNIRKDQRMDWKAIGTASVAITKEDEVGGTVRWQADCREGERLGWSLESGKGSFVHSVFSHTLGRRIDVDFNTGLTLDEIILNQPLEDGERTEVIVVGTGNGGWEWLRMREAAIVSIGGLRVARPDPEQIACLLRKADDSWLSRNPKVRREAQEIYRTLLAKWPTAELVVHHHDRMRQRADAETGE